MKLLFLFFTLTLFYSAESYKILFYNPKFGISHVSFMGKIADTLAGAGHEVVVYQPVLNENVTFSGTKDPSIRYYTLPRNLSFLPEFSLELNLWDQSSFWDMRQMMTVMTEQRASFCDYILHDDKNFNKLKEENFDLAITEQFELCGFGVLKKIGMKKYITAFAGALTPMSASALGIKHHPSYLPGFMAKSTDQMSFKERLFNFISYFVENAIFKPMFHDTLENVIKSHFPGFSLDEAIADSAFYFVNSEEHVDFAQPITHKIIYMGGLGKIQAKPLQKQYTDIFDSAKKGVILFSFGSAVQSFMMKPEMKKSFLDAFAEFPEINFIWKYEKDEHHIAKGYKNVFTGKWLPQNDILDHPKLLAFISHGGMNSVMEGATKGVPMICIPVFGDQPRNSLLLERRGTAIKIDKSEITKENLIAAIKEIISNGNYRKNAQMLSKMVNAKPTQSEERIIKYAEFAAQFGDTGTLQTQGRYQSFMVLYSLDVILTILALIILATTLLIWIVKKSINFMKRKFFASSNVGEKKKKA